MADFKTPPAMRSQAVVGIKGIEGERLHATSIAHDFVQATRCLL
jgi:hypothetical protein